MRRPLSLSFVFCSSPLGGVTSLVQYDESTSNHVGQSLYKGNLLNLALYFYQLYASLASPSFEPNLSYSYSTQIVLHDANNQSKNAGFPFISPPVAATLRNHTTLHTFFPKGKPHSWGFGICAGVTYCGLP